MSIRDVLQSVKQFGIFKGIFDLTYRVLHRVCGFAILEGITLAAADMNRKYRELPKAYSLGPVDEETLKAFSIIEPIELSASFLVDALSRGDLCMGVFLDNSLVSFGWYSTKPTKISDELTLEFDPRFVYMYKGFTVPEQRGKSLHAFGMAYALDYFTEKGYQGLISYVEANNFRSIQSCNRLGYKTFGKIYLLKAFGARVAWATPGCSRYDFRLINNPVHMTGQPALS